MPTLEPNLAAPFDDAADTPEALVVKAIKPSNKAMIVANKALTVANKALTAVEDKNHAPTPR